MSANVQSRGIPSPPAEGRFSDSSITMVDDTLNVCRMTDSMIEIAANNLFGLRQYRTSGDLIQKEICECEVSAVDFFCVAKCLLRPRFIKFSQCSSLRPFLIIL